MLYAKAQRLMEGQASVPDPTLFQLVKTAEEAALACAAAAEKCASGADPDHAAALASEADEAAQRASWAASAAQSREVPQVRNETFTAVCGFIPIGGDLLVEKLTVEQAQSLCKTLPGCKGFTFKGQPTEEPVQVYFKDKWEIGTNGSSMWTSFRYLPSNEPADWVSTMKSVAKQAAEAAMTSAMECKNSSSRMPSVQQLVRDRGGSGTSKVPCRFHQQGRCANGFACQFSHEANVARPLYMKMDKPCLFFARGQCARGTECPFAHGEEERKQITELRVKRGRKRPGEELLDDWAPIPLAEGRALEPIGGQDRRQGQEGGGGGRRAKPRGPWSLPQATPWY